MTRKMSAFAAVALGFALAALPRPAAAQHLHLAIGVNLGGTRLYGVYETRLHYRVPRAEYCEADGPYLYCWSPAYRPGARVTVHAYERPVAMRGRAARSSTRGEWQRIQRERIRARERAVRAYHRWYDARGYRNRDRLDIRVAW